MKTYNNSIVIQFDTVENGNAGAGKLVTVFDVGTTNKAPLFDSLASPIDNPVQADGSGNYTFTVSGGTYDLHIDYGLPTQTSILNEQIAESFTDFEEDIQLLSAGQLIVAFNGVVVADANIYVDKNGGDRGRLFVNDDYTITGESEITLNNSFPAGAKIMAASITPVSSLPSASSPAKISFVFDDAWASLLGAVKTLFDARGYKCAGAIPVASLGNPGRLTINDMPKILEAGFEVINHNTSGDVANTANYGQAKFRGEVQTNWSALNSVGVNPVGFQAPSSILNDEYLGELSKVCTFAFTQATEITPIPEGANPLKLHRFTIEGNTLAECVDAVDGLAFSGGTLVFYAHDIIFDDTNYKKIVAIMDRAEEIAAVDIVGVTESLKETISFPQQKMNWVAGKTIDNNPNGFAVVGDGSLAVGNVSDITVTINTAGQVLVQKTIDLPEDITNGELITFSCAFRKLSGTFGNSNNIGIQLKDVGDVVLYSDEIADGELNTTYTRYNIGAAMVPNAVKATVFLRVDGNSIGAEALLRNPVLRVGTNVSPQVYVETDSTVTTISSWPAQTLAGIVPSTTALEFPVTASNGLFSVSSSSIVFQREAKVCVTCSVVASGTNVGDTWNGGWLNTFYNSGTSSSLSPMAGGANRLAASDSITLKVVSGSSLAYSVFADGEDVAISTTNSRFSVFEILD